MDSQHPFVLPVPGRHVRAAVSPPARSPRRGRSILTVAAALTLLGATTVIAAWATTERTQTYSFFADADVSGVPVDLDSTPVELGLRFTSSSNGTLPAVRFLKATGAGDSHPITVWSARGEKLATATSTGESGSGWQEVRLPTPVRIEAGQVYVVSYRTSRYRATEQYFTAPVKSGPLTTSGVAGVYTYGTGLPASTWRASNYWVDVAFAPDAGGSPPSSASAAPTVPPTRTASATPSSTRPPTSKPSPTSPTPDPLALPRVAWEGGPAYYGTYPVARAAGWTDPAFFPIGVWYEGVLAQDQVDLDRAVGLNTYIMLTSDSDLGLIRRNGMFAMVDDARAGAAGETPAWVLNDEVDMWGGPGNGTWTGRFPGQGDVCVSGRHDCGHDVLKRLSAQFPSGDGRMRYANFGKGVMFWQSDGDAAAFVNRYTSVTSNDIYWYTDPNVCTSPSEGPALGVTAATCRRAANYGLTMDRMRELDGRDGKRQPIYAFVEVGHPFKEKAAPTITGDQVAGAVMNSLIHEARGIIYFNHNFGGSCISQHVLRDRCGAAVRPAVTELNKRVSGLARVLNTQSYDWRFNPQLDTMLKAYDGAYYIFAMPSRSGGTGAQRLTLPPKLTGATAEVLFENRTVPISGGTIQDSFAKEFSYHIYRIRPTG